MRWPQERRDRYSRRVRANNPMSNPASRRKHARSMKKRNADPKYWKKKQDGVDRYWRNLSEKGLAKRVRSCIDQKYITGYVKTKFGSVHHDSKLERDFLLEMNKAPRILAFKREHLIHYSFDGNVKRYLLDFVIEFTDRHVVLIETKNSWCLYPKHRQYKRTMAKIRAAKKYAKKCGFEFVLLTSIGQIKMFFKNGGKTE